MTDWQPGDALYRSDEYPDHPDFNISVDTIRPIYQLIDDLDSPFPHPRAAARWPEPLPNQNLALQEVPRL